MKDETRRVGDAETRREQQLSFSPRLRVSASFFIPHPSSLIPYLTAFAFAGRAKRVSARGELNSIDW